MSKPIFHKARRWPLAALAVIAGLMSAVGPGLAAGLNEPAPAQPEALTQAGGASTLVWIGAFAGGVVPMRPVEFVRQANGDVLIKGGVVVKATPMVIWPVLRGGAGRGHFFVLAPSDARGGVYWLMDFSEPPQPMDR